MSDNEPTPPKGAVLAGRTIMGLGWLMFIAAAALAVFVIGWGTQKAGGLILALLIVGCGGVSVALGRSIQNSRQ
jgi:hypothetical protein